MGKVMPLQSYIFIANTLQEKLQVIKFIELLTLLK